MVRVYTTGLAAPVDHHSIMDPAMGMQRLNPIWSVLATLLVRINEASKT